MSLIVKAKAMWVKSAPRKFMRIMDLMRGKNALIALAQLKFQPHKAARMLEKTIKSAMANAVHNNKMEAGSLVISELYVNKGVIMKRIQPRARGRAFPIKKRSAHVTVCLSSGAKQKTGTEGNK